MARYTYDDLSVLFRDGKLNPKGSSGPIFGSQFGFSLVTRKTPSSYAYDEAFLESKEDEARGKNCIFIYSYTGAMIWTVKSQLRTTGENIA